MYRGAALQVPRRRRKRRTRGERVPLPLPGARCERWSMDFVTDTLADGRGFRTLNIVDDFTRECVAIEVDRSLPGARVIRVLDRLQALVGLPHAIVLDNGPEFRGLALETWASANGVELRFIRPGKPIENAFVESFNGKFRDECLNEHWFVSIAEARSVIEAWRVDYNTVRPHSAPLPIAHPAFTLPAELASDHAWIWADLLSGTLYYYTGKPGFLIFFTDISTRLTLYRFVFERGDEQYIVWDNPGTIAFMREIERMGGVLQLRESR